MTTIRAFYLSLCKFNFTFAITSEVKHTTKVYIKPIVIVKSLYLEQKKDFDYNKPIYKTKNINNIKAKIFCKSLNALNLIQALMQKLDSFL